MFRFSFAFGLGFFLLLAGASQAQIFKTMTGASSFTSNAPLEVIKANSSQVQSIINITTRSFVFRVPMQSFNGFNSTLQRQHFNENYVESDKFPEGKFSGKIIEEVDLKKPGTYAVRAKGKLTLHGIAVDRIIPATVVVQPNTIRITCKFQVPLNDHNITVPKIVFRKIADMIEVDFSTTLTPATK